jgi:hypothetical protein
MRIPLNPVAAFDQITVAAPCPVSWDAMRGDDQVRFCGRCRQHVYNLSEMTAAEAVQLIEAKQGRLCVQLFRRRDGTLITADCPVGWRWRFFKFLRRRRMAWAASLFALVFLSGCPMPGGGNLRREDPANYSIASQHPDSNSSPSSPK